VVTNQSGIGRGYYTERDFTDLMTWMCARLDERGTPIDRVYHCPFHPEAVRPELRAAHPWRKPSPGMVLAARDDLGLDLGRSIMIGDQWTDMQAGNAAGVGELVLVGQPRGREPAGNLPVLRLPAVSDAARWLAARHSS
jgi:D-glycero-D-manno-heptose 1,7-bisphosphate phosphatase